MVVILILAVVSFLFTIAAFGMLLAGFPVFRQKPIISGTTLIVTYLGVFSVSISFCG